MTTQTKYTPDKPVTLKINADEIGDISSFKTILAIHYSEDGANVIKCEKVDNEIIFKSQEFSEFAIVGFEGEYTELLSPDKPSQPVQTKAIETQENGADNNTLVYFLAGAVLILVVTFILKIKNKAKGNR